MYSGSVIYNTHVPNLTAYHVQPKNIRLGAMVTWLLSLLFYFSNNHNGYGYMVTFVTFCTFCTFTTFTTFTTFSQKVQNPYSIWYLHSSFIIHN